MFWPGQFPVGATQRRRSIDPFAKKFARSAQTREFCDADGVGIFTKGIFGASLSKLSNDTNAYLKTGNVFIE